MNDISIMKKYVIITTSICNMGGAEIYIRNRCQYLLSKGWLVDVLSAREEPVLISDLNKYPKRIPELFFYYYMFSKKKVETIIDKIHSCIYEEGVNEYVIESTNITCSLWGEMVAKKLSAKHIVYLLPEQFSLSDSFAYDFLLFKNNRKELAGIVKGSIHNILAPYMNVPIEDTVSLPAPCINVEQDVDHPIIEELKKIDRDYTVGLLSRLDKPFVLPAIEEFKSYAKRHKQNKFLLLLIGGATGRGRIKRIRQSVAGVDNIILCITGFLYPLPTRLLDCSDVYITTAGSSWVCEKSGVPTITYDGQDYKPIGVFHHTTDSYLFRKPNEPIVSLSELLNDVLCKKTFIKKKPTYGNSNADFTPFDKFIDESTQIKEYYPLPIMRKKTKLSFLLSVIGPQKVIKLL